jgi:hypothetical protein
MPLVSRRQNLQLMQFLLKGKRDFNVAPRETKRVEEKYAQAYFKTTSEVLEYLFSLLQIVLRRGKVRCC